MGLFFEKRQAIIRNIILHMVMRPAYDTYRMRAFDFWEVGIVITFIFCGTASKDERNYKAYVHTGYRQ